MTLYLGSSIRWNVGYAKTDDSSVYFEIYGEGKPLVLVCGLTGSVDYYWQAILPELARNFQVIVFDSRGMGKTQYTNKNFLIEGITNDIFFLLDHLGIEKVSLFGQSMGASVTQTFARKYPQRVENIILCNGFHQLNQKDRIMLEGVLSLLEEKVPVQKLFYLLMPWIFSEKFLSNTQTRNKLKEFYAHRSLSPEGVKHQIEALLVFNSGPWLKEIDVRTLVISSKDDLMFPLSEGEFLSSKIPDALYIEIEGGHASHVEQAPQLVSIIRDFNY